MNHQYAIMWDCNGLEAVQKVPDPADMTFAVLANKPQPKLPNLNHWELRARANSQRHYEIYVVETVDGITADDICDMFEADPQMAADTIRRLGTVFYSDRATQKAAIV
jgi:hypothetical protein